MPTIKPRITITLSDTQHALLRAMGDLQGQSMSAIVVDLISTVEPVLERLVVILQAAKDAPETVRQELKRSAENAESEFLPIAEQMMGQLDLLISSGVSGDRAAKRSESEASDDVQPPRPPTSNRGVSSPKHTKSKSASVPMPVRVRAKSSRGVSK